MDILAAFDNAVEKFLDAVPVESLPEQLATLRFLFEEELEKPWFDDSVDVEMLLQARRR